MGSPSAAPSLGRRFLLTVVLGAVLPLGLIGLWATRSAARSGRTLLRSQLETQLGQAARDVEHRWQQQRSDLLLLAENEPVRVALRDSTAVTTPVPAFVQRAFGQMPAFNRVVIRDARGRARWSLVVAGFPSSRSDPEPVAEVRGIPASLPILDVTSGDTIGRIEAVVRAAALLPLEMGTPSDDGPVLAAFLPGAGAIVPPAVNPLLFSDERAEWRGHHWLTARRTLREPELDLVVAGALDPYVRPFEGAARTAWLALLAGSLLVLAVVVTVTRRLTTSVERDLAQHEALAAVGGFASELAHEVRNPLTAMRLDLQRVDEVAPDAVAVRGIAQRVLAQVDRLDRAVTGALRVARSPTAERGPVDLRDVLEDARRAAEPEFHRRGAALVMDATWPEAVLVDGDAASLQQLFLNLLINAAQALAPGGEAHVGSAVRNGSVELTVADSGAGMTPQQLRRVQEPYRSSKRDGTGLGLKIARRIVASHHGEMELQSAVGRGTTVLVRLPRRGS